MKKTGLILGSFAFISAFVFYDLFLDWGAKAHDLHLLFELLVGLASLGWMFYFLKRYLFLMRINKLAEQEVEDLRRRTSQFIEGLSQSIDTQFESWKLTATEKEIALLLVKGLSTKEIASVREGSERTVRQHAQSIYAKSNLAGRAELAAFFLEDLLGPSGK